jgi:hypothetical protein
VIMAASKGQQALDNLGRGDAVSNGLFTRELIKQMRTPGLSASDMLRRVRGNVETAAAGVNHLQRPSLVDESSSDFFFYPAGTVLPAPAPAPAVVAAPSPAPAPPPPSAVVAAPAAAARPAATPYNYADAPREFDAWETAVRVNTRAAFESFLAQYPGGRYAAKARTRLTELGGAPAAASTPAVDPQVERDAWERAVAGKRKADYENYLNLYPNGRWAEPARAALKRLNTPAPSSSYY